MASIWVDTLGPNFRTALDLIEAAIHDCPDELWQANMWEVPGQHAEVRGADGELVTDPDEQHALVQRNGQPWGVAWHALEVLDANLSGRFSPWEPWGPFGGRTGLDITSLVEPWSRDDLLGYVDYCRQRVTDTLEDLTDERAATLIGRRAQPYVARLIDKLGHVIEHGSQIRQFITSAGVAPPTRKKVGSDVRIRSASAAGAEPTPG
jgi:hypothetical protein